MRDILLLTFIVACLATTLRYPFVGLLTWAWFTLMAPHQAAFGVFNLPLNLIIAAVTLVSYVWSGELARFRFNTTSVLLILFAFWIFVSQLFSLNPENSAPYFDRFIKTLLFILVCVQMVTDKLRFHALLWILVLGIGFFAAKGALFTFVTLGAYRVQGLPMTMLEDNNHFGIAAATILPLILYLREQVKPVWLQWGMLALFCLTVVAVIGTHSRGAFLALVAFGGLYWLRSKHKIAIVAGLALLLIPTIAFMPAKWTERMATIGEATQDASFMGRVDAWVINYKLAKANPVTGAGMRNSYQIEIAEEVDLVRAQKAKAAHSIYFEILGGAGFVGLGLYLSLFAATFFQAGRFMGSKGNGTSEPWQSSFAVYAQISLAVFMVGGASTSMEMWDGYLIIIALIASLTSTSNENVREQGHALASIRKRNWRRKRRLEHVLDNQSAPRA